LQDPSVVPRRITRGIRGEKSVVAYWLAICRKNHTGIRDSSAVNCAVQSSLTGFTCYRSGVGSCSVNVSVGSDRARRVPTCACLCTAGNEYRFPRFPYELRNRSRSCNPRLHGPPVCPPRADLRPPPLLRRVPRRRAPPGRVPVGIVLVLLLILALLYYRFMLFGRDGGDDE
jgi:hypothetical protein